MAWTGVITDVGANNISTWHTSGTTLYITGVTVGKGITNDPYAATALVDSVGSGTIVREEKEDKGMTFTVQVRPFSTSFLMKEIGIWAKLGSSGTPFLLSLHQNDEGVGIPSSSESPYFVYVIFLTHSIDNEGTLEIEIDDSSFVAVATMEEALALKADKSDTVLDTTLSRGRSSNSTVGTGSFAFGNNVTASGNYSHAEGGSIAIGHYSHAEGDVAQAAGYASHSEGNMTDAAGDCSHAEGYASTARGTASHAEGFNTVANHKSQHVSGKFNVEDPSEEAYSAEGQYVEIVGNGTANDERSNARTLDWNGNERLGGDLFIDCEDDSSGGISVCDTLNCVCQIVTGSTNNTGHTINAGEYFIANGVKYKATASIPNGSSWSGSAQQVTDNDLINALNRKLRSVELTQDVDYTCTFEQGVSRNNATNMLQRITNNLYRFYINWTVTPTVLANKSLQIATFTFLNGYSIAQASLFPGRIQHSSTYKIALLTISGAGVVTLFNINSTDESGFGLYSIGYITLNDE